MVVSICLSLTTVAARDGVANHPRRYLVSSLPERLRAPSAHTYLPVPLPRTHANLAPDLDQGGPSVVVLLRIHSPGSHLCSDSRPHVVEARLNLARADCSTHQGAPEVRPRSRAFFDHPMNAVFGLSSIRLYPLPQICQ